MNLRLVMIRPASKNRLLEFRRSERWLRRTEQSYIHQRWLVFSTLPPSDMNRCAAYGLRHPLFVLFLFLFFLIIGMPNQAHHLAPDDTPCMHTVSLVTNLGRPHTGPQAHVHCWSERELDPINRKFNLRGLRIQLWNRSWKYNYR